MDERKGENRFTASVVMIIVIRPNDYINIFIVTTSKTNFP